MKYLLIILISISACFAEYGKIEIAEHIDTLDNYIIRPTGKIFELNGTLVFTMQGRHIDSAKYGNQIALIKDNKLTIFNLSEYANILGVEYMNHYFSGAVMDSKGIIWAISFFKGMIFKIDNGKLEIIDYLSKNINKDIKGNGIIIDKNDNMYILSNYIHLLKFDGKSFEFLEQKNLDENKFPHPKLQYQYALLDNKLFYQTINGRIAFFDLRVSDYFALNSDSLLLGGFNIVNFQQKKDNFILMLQNTAGTMSKFIEYSFMDNKFRKLDTLFHILGIDLTKDVALVTADDDYFYINKKNTKDGDTLFIINNNYDVKILDFYQTLNSKYIFANNNCIHTSDYRRIFNIVTQGIIVLKNPASVETPLNVLFVNNIYPNPAKTNVSIDFMVEPENLPNITVELYNLTGILQSKLDYYVDYNDANGQGTLNCNIENISNGYYIIAIDNGKRKVAKPFVVNKGL